MVAAAERLADLPADSNTSLLILCIDLSRTVSNTDLCKDTN